MVFTGDWVTASLFKSPRLFSVFWQFSVMLLIFSTWPPTSKSSRPFNNPLVTVPNAPITIGIIALFKFHSFFSILKQAQGTYLSFHIISILFCVQPGEQSRQLCRFSFFFFLLIIIRSGVLAEIRWSVCISKSHRSLCMSFSRTGARFCIYHLLAWSNFNFLNVSQGITLPTQSCLALYSFCVNLLHLLIMWLMVSSLSPHSLPYSIESFPHQHQLMVFQWSLSYSQSP